MAPSVTLSTKKSLKKYVVKYYRVLVEVVKQL